MGKTLINPKNQVTYGGDDEIPQENYYNGVFFSNPAVAAMFANNNWSTTLPVGPQSDPEPDDDDDDDDDDEDLQNTARPNRPQRPRRTPPGFHYEGDTLVPNEGTVYNEETGEWDINPPKKDEPTNQPDGDGGTGDGGTGDGGTDDGGTDDGGTPSGGSGQPDTDGNDDDDDEDEGEGGNPHWSNPSLGGGGFETAPGVEPTGTFQETIQEHKDKQLSAAYRARDLDMGDMSGIVGKGIGWQSREGASTSSGNLRRSIRKLAPSLINKTAKKE